MRFFPKLRSSHRATLRVSAHGEPVTFDALIVYDGGGRRMEAQQLHGQTTPFQLELPDCDVTVVVQPRDPWRTITAEYEREAGGRQEVWGRSMLSTPVIQRRGSAVFFSGIGRTSPGDAEPVPA